MFPSLTLLDDDARQLIHRRTLEVLGSTGVKYASPRALDLLESAGAAVDRDSGVARLPADLVEAAVARAPREVVLGGRDPSRDIVLDGSRTWLSLDGTGSNTLDMQTGERRLSTRADVVASTRIADTLDEVGVMWATVSPNDTAPNVEVLEQLALLLANTGKHVQPEVQRCEEVPYVMDMLAAASPDGRWDPARPIFSVVYCPVSPLQHEREMLEASLDLVELGVPMSIYTLATCGATAPITKAGGVLQTNAELLSAVVLFELVRPGAPVIYTSDCGVLDMRSGTYASCGPEAMLMNVALVEMARFYGLPVAATGLTSDTRDYSPISGFEGGASAMLSVLTRPDVLTGAGLIDSAQTLFLPKLILDAEFVRQCLAVQGGVEIDDEHLLAGLIASVGPGGHFLAAKETRRFLRSGELYQPQAYQRVGYDQWKDAGVTDVQRARDTVEEILASHEPAALPAGAVERIEAIIAAAAAELPER